MSMCARRITQPLPKQTARSFNLLVKHLPKTILNYYCVIQARHIMFFFLVFNIKFLTFYIEFNLINIITYIIDIIKFEWITRIPQ